MKILLSNDDGIHATGIRILRDVLHQLGHEVFIVAPSEQNSGASHRITLGKPLFTKKVKKEGEFYGISVDGTPADSVNIGLTVFYPDVDYVVTGINLGNNAGPSIYYSGTVAAAFEGMITKKKSLAFSLNSFVEKDFEGVGEKILPFMEELFEMSSTDYLLNINIPVHKQVQGVRIATQFAGHLTRAYEKRSSPWGGDYYWLSEFRYTQDPETGGDSDVEMLEEGYISATPLDFLVTDQKHFERLRKKNGELDYESR